MAYIKITLTDAILDKLKLLAESKGMKATTYIQWLVGEHVAEKEKEG